MLIYIMPFNPISPIEIFLAVFAFIAITYLGLAVYLKDSKSWTNRFFFILAIILDLYVVLNIFSLHPLYHTPENQIFWIRAVAFLAPVIALIIFLLVHTFPKNKIQLPKKYFIFLFISTFIFALIALTPLLFSSMSYTDGLPTPATGILAPLFLIYIVGIFLVCIFLLISRYRRSVGLDKIMIKYLLVGILITFSLIALFNIIIPIIFKSSNAIYLGPIYPIILMFSIGYAIVKYHFLDIQPIIARAVSYIFLLIILTIIYSFMIFYGANKIFGINLNIPTLLISALLIFTFQPLSKFIRKITDHLFFKDLYDEEKILTNLTHIITSTIDFDELSEKLLSTIIKEMRVTKSAILLVADNAITTAKSMGYNSSISLNDKDFLLFINLSHSENKRFFVISDLNKEEHKTIFRTYDIEALFPIWAHGKVVAFIILGPKLSGMTYSAQDLNLLDVFASESGIAIQNAHLYTDLKIALDAKSRFISVVSHQLRTPISGIRWGLETLKGKNNPEKQKEILDISYEKVVFLSDQLDDILIALDVITKDMSLQKVECNIQEICEEITKEFKTTINLNGLNIKYEMDNTTNIIKVDYSKFKKILKVIIKNAIVYSKQGGIIQINSNIKEIDGNNRMVVTVEDNGMGIIEEEKSHIFEEFFRSDRARIKSPDGLGLGMYISKIFARAHGGDISFESKGQDEGVKFNIIFPLD